MLCLRLLLLGLVLLIGSTVIRAEKSDGCFWGHGSDIREVAGFSVTVGRHPKADQPEFLDECAVQIKNVAGKEFFAAHDQAIVIDPITGANVTGDGGPNIVLEGYSGGAHCCWTYWIFSLGKTPKLAYQLYNERGVGFEEIRDHKGALLKTQDGRFDYFDDMCHACSPFPSVYLRFEGGRLFDASAEYEAEYEREIKQASAGLSAKDLADFRSEWHKVQPGDRNTFELVRQAVLTVVLSYLYQGKAEKAWTALEEMWPPTDYRRMKKLILRTRGGGFVHWAQDPSNFRD